MSHYFHLCPTCGEDMMNDIPCSRCGYDYAARQQESESDFLATPWTPVVVIIEGDDSGNAVEIEVLGTRYRRESEGVVVEIERFKEHPGIINEFDGVVIRGDPKYLDGIGEFLLVRLTRTKDSEDGESI